MKKRILALLTIFALVCTSAPLTVLAEKNETKEEVKEEKETKKKTKKDNK
jgi:sortase (surface protein transpeptidase)